MREIGLALGGVELGQLDLRETGGDRIGGVIGQLGVEFDGLVVAAGLVVEVGEGLLGERGELLVPAVGDLLEGRLSGAGLAGFDIGKGGEVTGVLALLVMP